MNLHPRIAVSAPRFSLEPFEKGLERIEKEFSVWEMITEGDLWLPSIKDGLKEIMESTTLRFSIHAQISDINIASINPTMLEASRKELKDTIGLAGELGISPVTMHIGFISPLTILNKDKARSIARESLLMLDKAGEEHGVALAAENMPRTKWAIFTDATEILEAVEGTGIQLCFDIGHANISSNIDDFLPLVDIIRNIHIHDNRGKWDEHLILGQGDIDLKRVVDTLHRNYRGNWVIECTRFEGITFADQ